MVTKREIQLEGQVINFAQWLEYTRKRLGISIVYALLLGFILGFMFNL